MCGICGVVALKGQHPDQEVLARMVETIHHRGPDDSGVMVEGPCGLGNTRLAIIDLSPNGHQPMYARHRRAFDAYTSLQEAWIAYNGEVYNFQVIRAALEATGHHFQSGTDTETLLHAYLEYGEDSFIKAFNGMFALAIWDQTRQRLILVRDRLGQKPLYYYQDESWFVFGSEIKALLAHPAITPRLEGACIPHYLAYGHAPSPNTLFEGIKTLPPGHLLTLDLSPGAGVPRIRPYWEPPFPGLRIDSRPEEEIAADLLSLLRTATRLRLISDVPLGAFLSGGLDSAAIVALMAQESPKTLKTFSIGFEGEPSFDETRFARRVAARFVTEHQEFIVKPDVVPLLEELVWHHDQPFADSSAIPTYLVSKLARAHVTVALTGDGGDELFAGYDRFRAAQIAENFAQLLPERANQIVDGALRRLPASTAYGGLAKRATRFLQAANLPLPARYLSWVRYVPGSWVTGLLGPAAEESVQAHYARLFEQQEHAANGDILDRLLDINMRTYLPEDLLVKVDRCSMAVSLEARSPFLDFHLVEFAARLPPQLKMRHSTSKYILKLALHGVLPNEIINRRKHGFGVPVGRWFRTDLADYARAILLSERAAGRGILNMAAVQQMLDQHQEGRADLGHALWGLITFELWLARYFD